MCIKSAGGVGKKVGGGYVHRWPLYTEGGMCIKCMIMIYYNWFKDID
jgi:hypothetical protein